MNVLHVAIVTVSIILCSVDLVLYFVSNLIFFFFSVINDQIDVKVQRKHKFAKIQINLKCWWMYCYHTFEKKLLEIINDNKWLYYGDSKLNLHRLQYLPTTTNERNCFYRQEFYFEFFWIFVIFIWKFRHPCENIVLSKQNW